MILLAALLTVLAPVSVEDAPLPSVGEQLAELKAAFTAADGRARIVMVLSERSKASRSAGRVVRARILPEISSPDLTVLAVWVPEKDSDPETKARKEASRLAETRLSAFWAADPAALSDWRASLARTAAIEADAMPRSGLFAVYPPEARWAGEIPTPAFWTHIDKKLKNRQPPFDETALTTAINEHLEPEPEDVADIVTESRNAGGDPDRRYFLHGPIGGSAPPKGGQPLLVVLPGGSGAASFRSFVKRIGKFGTLEGGVVAQLISKKWTPDQYVIWPTAKSKVKGQKFTTESTIDAVIEDVAKIHRIDRDRIVILGWSSSGPALYTHALQPKNPVSRYFIAMSVYKPNKLPPRAAAKGKRFYLLHSPEDPKCAFEDSKRAEQELGGAGAQVKLVEYAGGHRWPSDVYPSFKRGLRWLLER